ncbi:OsmC family protein [Portibacter marinus]|uniref:OsmC family protein n=1 Tax=Portibacter marinus TaxID=2898660 RepID=UPI001F19BD53|nr:OsmC family protein [Portibacter marinus]
MKRKATAVWKGSGSDGSGILNGPSGVLSDTPYSAARRFENEDGKAGTNPEELIAAAHAGCYAMALSFAISGEGHTADKLDVTATVTLDKIEGGFEISAIDLDLKGKVEGMKESKFKELAENAKKGCPVSKALSAVPISLDITFG